MLFGKDIYHVPVPLGDFPAPALPSLSPQVWQAAFIHSSKNLPSIPRSKFSYSEDFVDNERLEYLGDALLYSIVASYLFRTYPRLRVGYLSAIRQKLVQNVTLARFARMYKMDQALEVGENSEWYRKDEKTLADTFEAFVGAVAHVHGDKVVTQWIEDLIRPYATQLYEFYAQSFPNQIIPEPVTAPRIPDESPGPTKPPRRHRLCGFIPLPFLWGSPETKSIAPAQTSNANGYGTLLPVSRAADYTRLNGEEDLTTSKQPSGSGSKKGNSKDDTKDLRSKSKERVVFVPSSVANQERLQTAKVNQSTSASHSSNQVKPSTSVPKSTYARPASQPVKNTLPAQPDGQTQTDAKVSAASNTNKSSKADKDATMTKPASGTVVREGVILPTNADNATPSVTTNNLTTPAKTILKREDLTGSISEATSSAVVRTADSAAPAPPGESTDAVKAFVTALQSARSDPVGFLERHPMFHGRKAKKLTYDDFGTTPNKEIVRVKIDNQVIAQSAAAGQDKTLAKARAAFKAIEALCLLPDPPSGVAGQGSSIPETPKQEAKASAEKSNTTPFTKPSPPFPTPVLLSKQADKPTEESGPLPACFYSSLPNAGKESYNTTYYITSVKGFSSGTYYSILNGKLQMVGQAKASKKAVAMEEAQKLAALGQIQKTLVNWSFEESRDGKFVKEIKLMKNVNKEATGPVPLLTHALSVDEAAKARIAWLEWFSEDKKAWKCAVLVDGIFQGSAKHADRKIAVSLASWKALDELEKASK